MHGLERRRRAAASRRRDAASVALRGTIRGTIVDTVGMDGIVGLGVSFGSGTPAVDATGIWVSNLAPVTGELSGAIAFIENGGPRTICPTADWLRKPT
jgi:hypothetical protein